MAERFIETVVPCEWDPRGGDGEAAGEHLSPRQHRPRQRDGHLPVTTSAIDLWESIAAAATKPFGFQAFYPGPGVGGHCIPIDPNYLSYKVRTLGYPFRFVELAQEISGPDAELCGRIGSPRT